MKQKHNMSKYYDFTEMLSYKKILNFIVGIRGVGKTFRFKKWGVDDFFKTGNQFMWVRRYKTETKKLNKWWNDIAFKYKDHKLDVKGDDKMGTFLIDGKICGYYVTLSLELTYKSVPFPLVDKIIFDEFLIARNSPLKYLADDVFAFLSLMDTVFRDRENVRGAYLLANNMSFINPYFTEFNIKPFNGRFMVTDDFLVEYVTNEVYVNERLKTRFGKLIDKTRYGDYALRNKAIETDDKFVMPRPKNSVFMYGVIYNTIKIGFWLDKRNGYLFADTKIDESSKRIYALTREDNTPNVYYLRNYKNTMLDDLPYFFENGLLYFNDEYIKTAVFDILQMLRCK